MTTPRQVKRIATAVVGGTVVLIGIALVVLPGPAIVVVPAGLAILATEFAWAKRWLDKVKSFLPGKRAGSQSGAEAKERGQVESGAS